jgi:uncharacterized membrane protein YkvA (DUF1232 family)
MMERLKQWAGRLRRDVVALSLAASNPRVPWYAKALAAAVAAYALSPIDLIPDFIPVLGQLDDLILVPLGIWLVVKLIPAPVMADLRSRAAGISGNRSIAGLVLVLLIWAAILALVTYHFWTISV